MQWFKATAFAIGGLLFVLLVALFVLYTTGNSRLARTYEADVATLSIRADSLNLARGGHLATTLGCRHCHGQDLSGKVYLDVPPFRAVASNLTSGEGGTADRYRSASDWDRAIRHGIRHDGLALTVMPSKMYHHLSDADAAALVAYLQRVPPVDNTLPATAWKMPGRVLAGLDREMVAAAVTLSRPSTQAPEPGPTATYGAYLTRTMCNDCHGPRLHGADAPSGLFAPSLLLYAERPVADFAEVLRTGIALDGRQMDQKHMPWDMTAALTDDEVAALHHHLATLQQPPGQPMQEASAQ